MFDAAINIEVIAVLIIGEDEMVNGKVGVKVMSTGKQREMELSEFINEIK